jgi:bacteriorhodopsin
MQEQTPQGRILIRNTRLLLLATWGFYPIVYLLPMLGVSGAAAIVAVQVGYCIADVAAKAGYGLMIFAIANEKSKAAGWKYESASQSALAPSK